MKYSPESLVAFVEAAALGSFSAAARKLKKSQSTVSISIANFESDMGCVLFDRSGRQPVLNDSGHVVLGYVQAILSASDQLDALSMRLSAKIEPLLSVVMSDVYNLVFRSELMTSFGARFPDTELQWGPAEGADVIAFIQQGLAHIGILAAHEHYPPDVATRRLPIRSEFGIYVCHEHALTRITDLRREHLADQRQLFLKTYTPDTRRAPGKAWSAPDYLTLLEIAARGLGWAELPRVLVERFGKEDLVELKVPGYPRLVDIDVAWARRVPLGPAGQWVLEQLLSLE